MWCLNTDLNLNSMRKTWHMDRSLIFRFTRLSTNCKIFDIMFSAPKVPVLLLRFKLAGQCQVWLGFSLFDFAVAVKLHFFGHATTSSFSKLIKSSPHHHWRWLTVRIFLAFIYFNHLQRIAILSCVEVLFRPWTKAVIGINCAFLRKFGMFRTTGIILRHVCIMQIRNRNYVTFIIYNIRFSISNWKQLVLVYNDIVSTQPLCWHTRSKQAHGLAST